jgi:arginase
MSILTMIGVPSSAGANALGLERSPDHLRKCGLVFRLAQAGIHIREFGDLEPRRYRPDKLHPTQRNIDGVVEVAEDLLRRADLAFATGAPLLVLGGDCTITVGVAAAARRHCDRLGIVYLDSQTDLNTPDATTTGIMDSMGLAHMLGYGGNALCQVGGRTPVLDPDRLIAFGYHPDRINEIEHRILAERQIAAYPATIIQGKVQPHAWKALGDIETRCDGFLLHFDVDVIDFTDFPVADAPVYRGFGLSLAETMQAVAVFANSPKLMGIVLTEFNPDRDPDGSLGRHFVEVFVRALSREALEPRRPISSHTGQAAE